MMEYHSATKKNELLTHATKWMNVEDSILSEKKKLTKSYIHNSIYMKYSEQVNPQRQISGC